jgi:hypothetical protein
MWGIINNETSTIEFLEGEPNNHMKIAGKEATYLGKDSLEMEGGGGIKVGE